MEMQEFILSCLRFGCYDTRFDDYCEAFSIDFSEEEIHDALKSCAHNFCYFGHEIYRRLFEKIIDNFHRAPLKRELWDYNINGDASDLIYDGNQILDPQDIEDIINELEEQQ